LLASVSGGGDPHRRPSCFSGPEIAAVLAESLLAAAPFEMLFLSRQKKGTNRLMTYVTMFLFSQGG
jgi:hypothetical protein